MGFLVALITSGPKDVAHLRTRAIPMRVADTSTVQLELVEIALEISGKESGPAEQHLGGPGQLPKEFPISPTISSSMRDSVGCHLKQPGDFFNHLLWDRNIDYLLGDSGISGGHVCSSDQFEKTFAVLCVQLRVFCLW